MKPLLENLQDIPLSHNLAILLDVDGTISPIAPTPEASLVDASCQAALQRLVVQLSLVAVVSGRPAEEAARIVGVEGITYVGDHGLEELGLPREQTENYETHLATALQRIEGYLPGEGVLVEHNWPNSAIHYRLAADPYAARQQVLFAAQQAIKDLPIQLMEARMVVQLRPEADPGKGPAVTRLLGRLPLSSALFIGDDTVDVPGFQAVQQWAREDGRWGAGVAVLSDETPKELLEAADYSLKGVPEVAAFLQWLESQRLEA